MNEWNRPDWAEQYLAKKEQIPHRDEGEAALLSEVPVSATRLLDVGCGDGHLLSLLLKHCPQASGLGIDASSPMLSRARRRFSSNSNVKLQQLDLVQPLPDLGRFDCIASSFAIHHCEDERKRTLYGELFERLEPDGIFCNLEHVASSSDRLHEKFLEEMGISDAEEDPSNRLLDVETQLRWLREIGFQDVDCVWKWRELALLVGRRPKPVTSAEELAIDEKPKPSEVAFVSDQLESFNKQVVGRDDFRPIHLVIREHGNVVAGLNGLTGWNWLYVQTLWVKDSLRHHGLGTRLLEHAETMAKRRGCVGACLSSFDFQAPEFYERFGYSKFGKIDAYPEDKSLHFLSKRFA